MDKDDRELLEAFMEVVDLNALKQALDEKRLRHRIQQTDTKERSVSKTTWLNVLELQRRAHHERIKSLERWRTISIIFNIVLTLGFAIYALAPKISFEGVVGSFWYLISPERSVKFQPEVWIAISTACLLESGCDDPRLIYAQWATETGMSECSEWKDRPGPNPCKSPVGAEGPCQFMPGTWTDYAEPEWDKYSLFDCARATARMNEKLQLFDQPSRDAFATRFSGSDGGACWNCGPVGYQQALEVWDIWHGIDMTPRWTILNGNDTVSFSIAAQSSNLDYQRNVRNFFAYPEGDDPDADFSGSVTIEPKSTLDVNAYFGPYLQAQGMRTVVLPGDGACNAASMLNYVASHAGLTTRADDLSHPVVPGVPAGYYTTLYTEGGRSVKNLWITNPGDDPATIHWDVAGDQILMWVTRP